MTVRVGNMTFTDWVSLPLRNQYTDTFIFRISAYACLPPFEYAPLLERMVAHVRQKRPCASLWVQVESPGDWYVLEVQRSLRGLKLPFVVSRMGDAVQYVDFSYPPTLMPASLPRPPKVEIPVPALSHDELRCLQALGRMERGSDQEIASLTGLPAVSICDMVTGFQHRKLVTTKIASKHMPAKRKPTQLDFLVSRRLTRKGLFTALRSWGVPRGTDFSSRREEHLAQIGTAHRYKARMWSAWLKTAYPQAEIWTAWSEVRLPRTTVIPDGLAWGRIGDHEILFWLEVGDEHKSREKITEVTGTRLRQARVFCERTGVNLVYAQLGPRWVREAVRWACTQLSATTAVVLGDPRRFGMLPIIEWGGVTAWV